MNTYKIYTGNHPDSYRYVEAKRYELDKRGWILFYDDNGTLFLVMNKDKVLSVERVNE